MPKTESNSITLGTRAPDFILPDANGNLFTLDQFKDSPALLVAFISNRCPFVVLIREALAKFASDHADKGLAVVAINSNDAEAHPEETLERIGAEVKTYGYGFISRMVPRASPRPMGPPVRRISFSMIASGVSPITASSTTLARAMARM
ncbi:redoxin [Sinorhizobium medicae]|nr:redoxin family protein [Sinorhizobium medicae]TWA20436.1 redoxin [Sinorhizobium medicae]